MKCKFGLLTREREGKRKLVLELKLLPKRKMNQWSFRHWIRFMVSSTSGKWLIMQTVSDLFHLTDANACKEPGESSRRIYVPRWLESLGWVLWQRRTCWEWQDSLARLGIIRWWTQSAADRCCIARCLGEALKLACFYVQCMWFCSWNFWNEWFS